MSERNVADDWKLEETGETLDRWKLEAAGQRSVAPWQLQDPAGPEEAWQPVSYARERRSAASWLLPSLVVLAFVAVVAYLGWIGLTRLGLLPNTANNTQATPVAVSETTPTGSDAAIAPSTDVTTTVVATPTQTPVPTPILAITATPAVVPTVVQVEQQFVVITDTAGVNARSAPTTTATIVQLLNQGQRLLVVEEDNGWLQIALTAGQVAWVSVDVVDTTTELVTLSLANQRRAEYGLPALANPGGDLLAPNLTLTNTAVPTLTGNLTSTLVPSGPPITVTIAISTGLNARAEPAIDADVITLLPNSSSYRAVSRSADSQWLQVSLVDGATAWVFAQYVTTSSDASTLPLPSLTAGVGLTTTVATTATGALTSTGALTATGALTTTGALTPTGALTATTALSGTVVVTVESLSGANACVLPTREAESLGVYPFGTAWTAIGRSADGEWIQVEVAPGELAWVLTSAAQLSVEIATLPVVTP